jgi:PKD repeat protein
MAVRRGFPWVGPAAPAVLAVLLLVPLGSAGPAPRLSDVGSFRTAVACLPCGPAAGLAARPSDALIDWQNVTAEQFGNVPPASAGASMAFDPGADELVWFGGCSTPSCSGDQTWLFGNGTWTNDTANLSVAPSARSGAGTEYDPHGGGILLFGGAEPGPGAGVLANDTWTFTGGTWRLASTPCPSTDSVCDVGARSDASLAYDANRSVNGSILFGGCVSTPACTTLDNQTWRFNDTSSQWQRQSLTPAVGAPSARFGAAMAYDPDLQALVLFGGSSLCGTRSCPESDTWVYDGRGNWTNVTSAFGGAALPGRVFGSLVWDPVRGEMLLSGGSADVDGLPLNSTYVLTCRAPGAPCNWSARLDIAGTGLTRAAVASNATGLDPMFVGGANATGTVTNATWAYSALPDLNVGVSPSRPEISERVDLNATAVASVDPEFEILWGDGTSERSTTGVVQHVYSAAGTFNVEVAVTDPNGSANLHLLGILVVPAPAGSIVVEYPTVDVGISDYFTAVPALATGTPPFNFSWNFGAPPIEYGPSVRRTFTTPGPVTVNVSMVDSNGLHGSNSTTVQVNAAPSATIAAQYTPGGSAVAERGVPTSLIADVQNGSGPFNFSWEFGDGMQGWGIGPSHVYSTTAASATVGLVVLDTGGGSVTTSLIVRLVAPLSIQRLSETPATPDTGSSVQFSVDVTGGAGPETFTWSFGDGATEGGIANASHTYGTAGTFIANVSVDDGAGGDVQAQIPVTVSASPASDVEQGLTNPWVLVGVGLVVLVAAVVYVRRRRTRAQPSPDSRELEP